MTNPWIRRNHSQGKPDTYWVDYWSLLISHFDKTFDDGRAFNSKLDSRTKIKSLDYSLSAVLSIYGIKLLGVITSNDMLFEPNKEYEEFYGFEEGHIDVHFLKATAHVSFLTNDGWKEEDIPFRPYFYGSEENWSKAMMDEKWDDLILRVQKRDYPVSKLSYWSKWENNWRLPGECYRYFEPKWVSVRRKEEMVSLSGDFMNWIELDKMNMEASQQKARSMGVEYDNYEDDFVDNWYDEDGPTLNDAYDGDLDSWYCRNF